MSIQIKNNATGFLSTAISASDTGIALESGDGAEFPSLGVGDYFYATLVGTDDSKEIVKVTARSSDSLTVTRAQESTTAQAFAAGTTIELRVTKQNLVDAVAEYANTFLSTVNTWLVAQSFSAIVNILGGIKLRWYNSANTNYHGVRNNSNVLTLDYNASDYLTIGTAGLFDFTTGPTVGGLPIYRQGGTDVAVADGGTGGSTASAARANLGLAIGTDVQAYSAALADFLGQTIAADKLVYADGAASYAVTDLPAFGRTLIANASAADARSDLGLGTMAIQAASSVSITGGTATGMTDIQARVHTSPETGGTLTALSANSVVYLASQPTINPGVFTAGDIIVFYSGATGRNIVEGSGMTLRLSGSASTGTRALGVRAFAPMLFITSSEAVLSGSGSS